MAVLIHYETSHSVGKRAGGKPWIQTSCGSGTAVIRSILSRKNGLEDEWIIPSKNQSRVNLDLCGDCTLGGLQNYIATERYVSKASRAGLNGFKRYSAAHVSHGAGKNSFPGPSFWPFPLILAVDFITSKPYLHWSLSGTSTLQSLTMGRRTAGYAFLVICLLLAVLLITRTITPLVSSSVFAVSLVILGITSKGFRKKFRARE